MKILIKVQTVVNKTNVREGEIVEVSPRDGRYLITAKKAIAYEDASEEASAEHVETEEAKPAKHSKRKAAQHG